MLKKFFIYFCVLYSLATCHATIDDDPLVLNLTDSENVFWNSDPSFTITSKDPFETLWWQLSSSSEFPAEETVENIIPASESFSLSESGRTLLSDGNIYFLRVRGQSNGSWGNWTEPFTFTVNENINLHLCKRAKKRYEAPPEGYERNPFVDEETWNTLAPYFLPKQLPVKAELDEIFSKRRVLSSRKSMIKSGFTLLTLSTDKVIVAKHPYLKGYLIKAYSDEMGTPDWYWWKKRIDGVRAIEAKIAQCGYQGIMKTPKKWIYPLPTNPAPKNGSPYRKNFILVVEQMDILDRKHNLKAYKKKMTPQILNALYIMLTDLNLIDSIYADNTPFCKDGRLAFIDTEHAMDTTRLVPITTVAKYLSPQMYSYWEQLIIKGGPER